MAPPSKLSGSPADLARALESIPEAVETVRASDSAVDALDRLVAAGQWLAAARLCAHALPAREAVWWACMCADHTAGALRDADRMVREAAEQWVRNRTDERRRAAMELARAAGLTTPEAWAGVGAFWSGGSMAPLGQPAVEPPAHLCPTAIIGAVLLASVRGRPDRQMARLERFIDSARDIAASGAGRIPPEEA